MIEIDSFTGLEQERQASDIVQLVKQERSWLKQVRPDTLIRHRNLRKSIEMLGHASMNGALTVHIPRRDGTAIGLITAIASLTVRHPLEDTTVTGRQFDYWTAAGVTMDEHCELVENMIHLHGYEGTVLATLTAAETERAIGIPAVMQAVGKPSWLEIPQNQDHYGLSRIPDLQLYVAMA